MYKLLGKLPRRTGSPRRIRPVADWQPVLPRLQFAWSEFQSRQVARRAAKIEAMKTSIRLFEIFFALLCLALLPNAQAVIPPPDGGYPGFNTAEGQNALFNLTTGQGNTAVGWFSLSSNTDGSFNTGVGAGTLVFNIGNQNTASGVVALLQNTTGSFNTANGALALSNNTEGDFNTATGDAALFLNTTGNGNTATGAGALPNNTSGGGNIAVGADAGVSITTANNVICIGLPGQNVSNSCYIGQIFGATSASGTAVFINSDGKLGTTTSSRRFKEEIKPMEQASEALFALKPVTFRYKKGIDPARHPTVWAGSRGGGSGQS